MTQTEVHFADGFPLELQPAVAELAERFMPFVNHSVDRWYVSVIDGDGQDADVAILRRYRSANLQLAMEFFKLPEKLRVAMFAHELAHAITTPMRDLAYELAKSYVSDESAYTFTAARIVEANELATEDLARAMLGLTATLDSEEGSD